MPNGPRIRANNVYGITSDNPLTAGASTFNSVSLPLLPVVASAHAVVVLDPKRVFGDPEIVVVTAHTASSPVATIIRGQYGTSPRQHPQGTAWAHVPIDEDWTEILTSTTRPSDPYRGQAIFETDTNRFVARSTADIWQQYGYFFDPVYCILGNTANQTHTNNGGWQLIPLTNEINDPYNMHDNVTNPSRITVPISGVYEVHGSVFWQGNATGVRAGGIRKNGGSATPNHPGRGQIAGNAQDQSCQFSSLVFLNANEFIELTGFQNSGGNLNVLGSGEFLTYFICVWVGRGN